MGGSLERLRRGRDVRSVLRGGQRAAGRLVELHRRDQLDEATRLAVVASRRVGPAVDQNRAKRLMREAARRLAWRPGSQLVAVARRACARADRHAVEAELRELGERLGAVRGAGADQQQASRTGNAHARVR